MSSDSTQNISYTDIHKKILTSVPRYIDAGMHLIPVGINKKPLIPWKEFQKRQASYEEIEEWTRTLPGMTGIGAVTGIKFLVIDVEEDGDPSAYLSYPTVSTRTGGGGWHFFYNLPDFKVYNSTKRLAPQTDIRGEGGYVILPPSVSFKGKYEWEIYPFPNQMSDLPPFAELFLKTSSVGVAPMSWFSDDLQPKGQRNDGAAKQAGLLLHNEKDETKWDSEVWPRLQKWNTEKCLPPLPTQELQGVYTSIKNRELTKRAAEPTGTSETEDKRPLSVRLVDMVLRDPDATLFKDQYDVAHVRLRVGDHYEIWPCGSVQFRRWIANAFYEASGGSSVPGKETIGSAVNILEGKVSKDGKQHRLFNRVGQTPDGTIWYDLADEKWRAVKITKEGWEVITEPPILFRRYSHLASQVEPVKGGDVRDIFRFVNVTNPDLQVLFAAYLVASYLPGFAHPMPYIYGPQGSAKSTLSKIVRKLVDPSKIEIVSLTRHEGDLAQQLDHHSLLFFDNVSAIPDWIADLLCRAITGSGFSKRELYTNDEDIIKYVQANVAINGINLECNKPDLLERSILFRLDRVSKGNRRQEQEIMDEFEREKPRLLGAILDAASQALALYPNIKVKELPRMADFALYGSAVAEALGYGQEVFMAAYFRNINSQGEEVVNDNTVAVLIMDLLKKEGGHWEGNATLLLHKLKDLSLDKGITDKLPGSPAALMREINTLTTPLEEVGVKIENGALLVIRQLPTNSDMSEE